MHGASATLETPSFKAIVRITICYFKSLDYANMPQSKQNISQIEPVDVVF